MKNLIKLSLFLIIVLGFSMNTFAQASENATASATIVAPITIVKVTDMNFGDVAVQTGTGGTVVLAPGGDRTTGGAGGVTLPVSGATAITAASFTVGGEGAYTYAITLPPGTVTIVSGENDMDVTDFTSDPSGTGTLSSGSQTLNVGATLNVVAGQAAGVYTLADGIEVTVNYN